MIVVDRRGPLIADSAGGAALGAQLPRPARGARPRCRARSEQVTRHSRTLGTEILATAVPVLRAGRTVGAVRITQSVAAVHRAVQTLDPRPGRCLRGVVLALGLLAGALIAQQIARPIRRLDRAARGVAAGDLDATAPIEGSSEQRSLARTFNEMTRRSSACCACSRTSSPTPPTSCAPR